MRDGRGAWEDAADGQQKLGFLDVELRAQPAFNPAFHAGFGAFQPCPARAHFTFDEMDAGAIERGYDGHRNISASHSFFIDFFKVIGGDRRVASQEPCADVQDLSRRIIKGAGQCVAHAVLGGDLHRRIVFDHRQKQRPGPFAEGKGATVVVVAAVLHHLSDQFGGLHRVAQPAIAGRHFIKPKQCHMRVLTRIRIGAGLFEQLHHIFKCAVITVVEHVHLDGFCHRHCVFIAIFCSNREGPVNLLHRRVELTDLVVALGLHGQADRHGTAIPEPRQPVHVFFSQRDQLAPVPGNVEDAAIGHHQICIKVIVDRKIRRVQKHFGAVQMGKAGIKRIDLPGRVRGSGIICNCLFGHVRPVEMHGQIGGHVIPDLGLGFQQNLGRAQVQVLRLCAWNAACDGVLDQHMRKPLMFGVGGRVDQPMFDGHVEHARRCFRAAGDMLKMAFLDHPAQNGRLFQGRLVRRRQPVKAAEHKVLDRSGRKTRWQRHFGIGGLIRRQMAHQFLGKQRIAFGFLKDQPLDLVRGRQVRKGGIDQRRDVRLGQRRDLQHGDKIMRDAKGLRFATGKKQPRAGFGIGKDLGDQLAAQRIQPMGVFNDQPPLGIGGQPAQQRVDLAADIEGVVRLGMGAGTCAGSRNHVDQIRIRSFPAGQPLSHPIGQHVGAGGFVHGRCIPDQVQHGAQGRLHITRRAIGNADHQGGGQRIKGLPHHARLADACGSIDQKSHWGRRWRCQPTIQLRNLTGPTDIIGRTARQAGIQIGFGFQNLDQPIDVLRCLDPFQLLLTHEFGGHGPFDFVDHRLRAIDLTGWCQRLHTRRNIHGAAQGIQLEITGNAKRGKQDLAPGNSNTDVRRHAKPGLDVVILGRENSLQFQRRPAGIQRRILNRNRGPENGKDAVARKTDRIASKGFNRFDGLFHHRFDHQKRLFRPDFFGQRRRADQIHHEARDPAFFSGYAFVHFAIRRIANRVQGRASMRFSSPRNLTLSSFNITPQSQKDPKNS